MSNKRPRQQIIDKFDLYCERQQERLRLKLAHGRELFQEKLRKHYADTEDIEEMPERRERGALNRSLTTQGLALVEVRDGTGKKTIA